MSLRYRLVRRDVWLWRWGVHDHLPPGGITTFLTRRAAERWIWKQTRETTWTEVDS